jgi:apolipoprotein N-acyltransferase
VLRPRGVAAETPLRAVTAASSGVLLALSFPHPGWWPLAWFALVPFFRVLRTSPPRDGAWAGFAFGVTFHASVLAWLLVFGPAAYAVVVLFAAAYCALFGWAVAAAGRGGEVRFVLVAVCAWVAVEWLRTLGPVAFPWALLGVSQWQNLPVLQLASVGGVYLVSAAVVAANAGLELLLAGRALGVVALAAVAAGWAWGAARLEPAAEGSLAVAAVQPNLAQQQKLRPEYADRTRSVLLELTRRAAQAGAAFVVWPEHYWPDPLIRDGSLDPRLVEATPPAGALVATGEVDGRWNTALVVGQEGLLGRHDKVRLVPLGEWWADPGPRYEPVPAPMGPAGMLICYEVVYPSAVRALVLGGARYLVHTTEEGWFGASAGPVQHLAVAVVRAVEAGRDVVRAASTGISAVVDAHGRLKATLPQAREGLVLGTVRPRSDLTPYARWGDLWVYVVSLGVAALSVRRIASAIPREAWPGSVAPALVAAAGLLLRWPPEVAGPVVGVVALVTGRGLRGAGVFGGRPAASLAASLGFVWAALWLVRRGFAAQGIPLPDALPGLDPVLRSTLAGLGEEVWLRGTLPVLLRSSPAGAMLASVAGSLLMHPWASGEVAAWHVVTAAVFFLVRHATGSVWGPLVARGVGDAWLGRLLHGGP